GSPRPADRPDLPGLHRLARHPPAQAARRGAAAPGHGAAARGGTAGAYPRHRRRARPLHPRSAAGRRAAARIDPAARLQRAQRARRPGTDRGQGARPDRPFQRRRRLRPRRPGGRGAAAEPGGGLRPVRAVRRQPAGRQFPGRPGRRRAAGWLSGVHRPALAPATGADRPRPDQPPRRPAVGDAPAQPGGDGSAGGRGRISQAGAAHRRVGHLQRVAGPAGGRMITASRPWRRALGWLAFLAPFFFASYGLATWVTSQRDDVGSLVFAWESQMPFWAWTIVPYWSIDLLYGLSLFLCLTRLELDRHALRLLAAQLVAVACFLLWPLRFTFSRPEMDGVFGLLFEILGAFDKPFNQAPSLHIALLVILWVCYARHVQGPWRWLLH